jgi:hypothetical protein
MVWWSKIGKSRVSKEQKTACLVTERERNKKLNSASSIGNDRRSFELVFMWSSGVGIGSHCLKVSMIAEIKKRGSRILCVLEQVEGGMLSRWGFCMKS